MIFKVLGKFFGNAFLYPPEQPFPKTPKDYGIEYKDVEFPAADGVKLSGWLLNEHAEKVIIMTHFGYRANRFGYQTKYQPKFTKPYNKEIELVIVAKRLVDAGYAVLMYDLRNHGISGKFKNGCGTGGVDEGNDVLGVVKFVANNESTKGKNIGLLSYCMGANATFFAYGTDAELFAESNVKALVAMSPLTNGEFLRAYGFKGAIYRHANDHYKRHTGYELDAPVVPNVKSANVPTLLVQGKHDPWTNFDFVNDVYEALPVEKSMYWIEATKHRFDNYNWFGDHPEKMLDWFDKYL